MLSYEEFRIEFEADIVKRAKDIARFCKKRYGKDKGEHRVPVMIATLAESFVAAAKASDCPADVAIAMVMTSFQHAYADEIVVRDVQGDDVRGMLGESDKNPIGFVPGKRTVH